MSAAGHELGWFEAASRPHRADGHMHGRWAVVDPRGWQGRDPTICGLFAEILAADAVAGDVPGGVVRWVEQGRHVVQSSADDSADEEAHVETFVSADDAAAYLRGVVVAMFASPEFQTGTFQVSAYREGVR